MGMFDDITCKYPLPAGTPTTQFQTKSLSCYLSQYEITEEGTLRCLSNPNEDCSDYHGDVYFYDGPYEFIARFTDGKITRLTDVSKPDS